MIVSTVSVGPLPRPTRYRLAPFPQLIDQARSSTSQEAVGASRGTSFLQRSRQHSAGQVTRRSPPRVSWQIETYVRTGGRHYACSNRDAANSFSAHRHTTTESGRSSAGVTGLSSSRTGRVRWSGPPLHEPRPVRSAFCQTALWCSRHTSPVAGPSSAVAVRTSTTGGGGRRISTRGLALEASKALDALPTLLTL